jgi:cysteinyl-tRNA synthetase
VLRAHYRSPLEVTTETIEASASSLGRIDALVRRLEGSVGSSDAVSLEVTSRLRERFVEAMDDDLDTPTALAEIFDAVRRANSLADEGDEAVARNLSDTIVELLGALGVVIGFDLEIDPETADLIRQRDLARKDRDFATSDALRSELEARGWVVEDTVEGTRVHR